MTLIIGIKCDGGIALGADGAATYGAMGQMTARQPTRNKLTILGGQAVVGVSGPIGLGQRIIGEVEKLRNQGAFSQGGIKPHEAMVLIRGKMWDHIGKEFDLARVFSQTVPGAMMSALSHSIVAVPVMLEPCLFQFDCQGTPEMATDDLPFVAIGSGQQIADPFLAFVRRIFWKEKPPTLEQGVFAAVWALQHAIDTSPGGVGPPIQIVTLKRDGKAAPVAQQLSAERWQEQLEMIKEFESSLPGVLEKASGKAADQGAPAPPMIGAQNQ